MDSHSPIPLVKIQDDLALDEAYISAWWREGREDIWAGMESLLFAHARFQELYPD